MKKSESNKERKKTKKIVFMEPPKCPLTVSDWLNYLISLRNSFHNDVALFYSQKNLWIMASIAIGAFFTALFIPLAKSWGYEDTHLVYVVILIVVMVTISIKSGEKFHSRIIDHKGRCRNEIDLLINSIIWGEYTNPDSIRNIWFLIIEELQKEGIELVKELKIEEKKD